MEKKNKIIDKEIYNFIFLFFLTVLSVYYAPSFVNKIFFLVILIFAYLSKNDYYWITYLVILTARPFRLFEDFSKETIHRIPEYNIIGNYGVTFLEIFLIVIFFKAILKNRNTKIGFKSKYYSLGLLIIWLISISFIYGTDEQFIKTYLRLLLYFSIVYSGLKLIDYRKLFFIYKVFIFFTLLILIDQILSTTLNIYLSDLIANTNWQTYWYSKDFLRAYQEIVPHFFVFVFSIAYLFTKNPPIKRNYLLLFLFLSYISVFLTGTRGWILAFTTALVVFYSKYRYKTRIINYFLIIFLLLSIALIIFPSLEFVISSNLERMSTLQKLAEGDMTAGGTLIRLTRRLPKLIEGIKINPLFGVGFSKYFTEYEDGHIGWANQILQMGFLGLIIFILFWGKFIRENKKINNCLNSGNYSKNVLKAFNIGLLLLLIIHTTSASMFNFYMNKTLIIQVSIFFIFSDLWKRKILEENKNASSKADI